MARKRSSSGSVSGGSAGDGGEWIAPAEGRYLEDRRPIDGSLIAEFPRSTAADVDRAVAAVWRAAPGWG